jgi:hypothetical protein
MQQDARIQYLDRRQLNNVSSTCSCHEANIINHTTAIRRYSLLRDAHNVRYIP